MFENLKTAVYNWNNTSSERQKLQHVYIVVVILGILVAGVTSLVNPVAGHNIVLIALFALLVFVTNAVVFNLLKAGFLSKLPTRPRRK